MSGQISHLRLLLAMLKKDLRVYSRNMVYLFLTILSLGFFVAIYWLVPDTVEEELALAITPPLSTLIGEGREELRRHGFPAHALEMLEELETSFAEDGLVLIELENEGLLVKVIERKLEVYRSEEGQFVLHDPGGDQGRPEASEKVRPEIGISFPAKFIAEAMLGHTPQVVVYADAGAPEEIKNAMQGFVREVAYELSGHPLPVEMPPEDMIILGTDRLGDQISTRARMKPLIAFFMMMMETFALASLISNEVLQRTVTALLVTPLRVWHFLLAKTLFGTALAVSQALLILLLIGAFTASNWSLLLVIVLLGAFLFTAVAMLVGSAGKDFIGQLMFSMLFLIPLMIPAFAVLFPGSVAPWVRLLPSYPVVRLLFDVTIHEILWVDALVPMIYAFSWALFLYAAGLVVLKRKVERL